MSFASLSRRVCPSCGEKNKINNQFCINCGINLKNSEVITERVMDESEPNKIEIAENLKTARTITLWCMICPCIGFLLFASIVLMPTLKGKVGITIASIIIGAILFSGWALWTRDFSKVRAFSISDNSIQINTPKRGSLQIKWADFDTVQIYGTSTEYSSYYHIKFYKGQNLDLSYKLQRGFDFHNSTCKRIRYLIQQYAARLNKQYIWGKKTKGKL